MPVDVTATYIRVRQHSPDRYSEMRNTPISEDEGIYAIYGKLKNSDDWEVQSLLFAKAEGWTVAKAKAWIGKHDQFSWPGTQAETTEDLFSETQDDLEDGVTVEDFPGLHHTDEASESSSTIQEEETDAIELPDADLPKYIEIRQHPPSHFTSYQHRHLDKEHGIVKSVGKWRKTGATVVQKLLFRRDKGWTDETVKQWFEDNPVAPDGQQYRHPDFSAVQSVRDTLIDVPCTLALLPEADPAYRQAGGNAFSVFDVIIIREGWGKNYRTGPDGRQYRDYMTTDFLQSLVPFLEGTAVQSVKLHKKEDGDTTATLPDRMQAVIEELKRHGHPPDIVNLIYDLGLEGNTIGLLNEVRFQVCENEQIGDEVITGAIDRGKFHLAVGSPHAEHSRRLFQLAWQQGLRKSLGLSINYRANAEFGDVEGIPAFRFLRATRLVSTESVINPAAGGGIVRVLQGVQEIMDKEQENQVQETKQAPVPDKDKKEPQEDQLELSATQTLPTGRQAVTPEKQEKEPVTVEKIPEEQKEQLAIQKFDATPLQQQLAELTGIVQGLAEGMKVQETALQAINVEKQKNSLKFMVSQSRLPKETKEDLETQIEEGKLTTVDTVNLAIKTGEKTQEVIQAQQSAPVFPGLSSVGAKVLKDPLDVMKIRSLLNWELPLTQAEQELADKYHITRFNGVQEEYIALTGDTGKNMRYDPQYFIKRIHPELVQHSAYVQDDGTPYTQTILTTTYTDFLTHVINRSLEAHYRATDKTWQKFVKVGDPYSDNKDHDEWILGQFPEIATVAQGASYVEVAYGKLEKMVSSSTKYGNLFKVTEEVVQDDNLGYVKAGIQMFSDAMNRTVYRKVMNLVLAFSTTVNGATMTDTIASTLYNAANRRNYINGKSDDFDKIVDLINLMLDQVDLMADDGTEAPLILNPWIFAADIKKIGAVRARVKGPQEPGRTDLLPNTLYMQNIPDDNFIGIHPAYLYEHPEILIVMPNPQVFAGVGMKYFRGMMTPEFVWEGNQQPAYGSAFSSDTLQLRLKFKFRLFYQRLKAFYALFETA